VDTELNSQTTSTEDTPVTMPDTPELSTEELALASLDEALNPKGENDDSKPADDDGNAAPVTATDVAEGDVAASGDAGKKPVDATDTGKKVEPTAKNEEVEKEITALGLKEASAERFRTLANEVRTFAPMKTALEQAGITDASRIPELLQHDKDYGDLIGMVRDTGATPEQYGMALDYIKAANLAHAGDRQAAEQAYGVMQAELQVFAKMLGKPVPGVYDPLAEFPDLAAQVGDGDLTQKAAEEIASLRKSQAMDATRTHVAQVRDQTAQQQNDAVQRGTSDLNQLGVELAAADPQYQAKLPVLIEKLREVQQNLPPTQWASMARTLYSMIQVPVSAAPIVTQGAKPAAKPVPGPIRGVSMHPHVTPVTDDPYEAMEQGIAAASQ
jgi:hypothetical protein